MTGCRSLSIPKDYISVLILLCLLFGDSGAFTLGNNENNPARQAWLERNLPTDGELFEGDIEMDTRLRRAVLGHNDKRSALMDETYKWPDARVPYEFDDSLLKKVKSRIKLAINEYHRFTCIKFIPRTNEENYVVFRSHPNRCSSPVGRQGGKQHITLGGGCHRLGTVLHEMMHTLGIIHEQSRPDRDEYVKVFYQNVKRAYRHNFEKYSAFEVTNMDVPYNYASLMHYRNSAFSKNGEDTLVSTKDPSLIFGQRIMFSEGDVNQLNRLYPCRKRANDISYDGLIENVE